MIYVVADHKSLDLRKLILDYLEAHHYDFVDQGAQSLADKTDIADFIPNVAHDIINSGARGIVVCGSGVGAAIGMNRYKGVRAVLAASPEYAEWAIACDNCNVLCLAEWGLKSREHVHAILDAWFNTKFEALPRRIERVKKLDKL